MLQVSDPDLKGLVGKAKAPPTKAATKETLGRLAELLEAHEIDPAEIGSIEKVRLNEWDGYIKNADGEFETKKMRAASLILTPSWESGPQWPVVQPAKPTTIKPTPVRKRAPALMRNWKIAMVLPDPQIGYRRDLNSGELQSFHDEGAMEVALQVIRDVDPHEIVNLGDTADFAEFSRFEQEPGFALTTQTTLDFSHDYLARQRANAPSVERIRLMRGNHDERLQKAVIANAKAAFGLRQAKTEPESWPVMSIPHLLRLDDLGVEYVDGYPSGIAWINDNLACIHGHRVKSTGSTAAQVVDDERVSIIFGHIHRIEMQYRTRRVRAGAKTSFAACPGCLCRLDGSVPSTKGSIDAFGRSVPTVENWQQGIAVIPYVPGDGPFSYEQVFIHEGTGIFRGKVYEAKSVPAAA